MVGAALAAAAVFAPAEHAARLLVMAATAGVLARFLTDWRACVAMTVVTVLVFVGFLAHRAGGLSPWPYTVVIGFAALLGRVQRRIHAVNDTHQASTPMLDAPHR